MISVFSLHFYGLNWCIYVKFKREYTNQPQLRRFSKCVNTPIRKALSQSKPTQINLSLNLY
ncbi:MAG: hypothetical protein SAJ72_23850, partial [Jaaginema sp. PMC 1080.18]|nr:hypothetical protein [Jaaginema sp. PMC 1080.18]